MKRSNGGGLQRAPRRHALIAPALGVLWLLGGGTSAFAASDEAPVSGEDEFSVQLSGAAFCPEADLDALHVCFEKDSGDGSCELFDVSASSGVLSSMLCPLRSILLNPEVVPTTGSVEISPGPIRGMSTGYLRALLPSGASAPTYAVTQSFPNMSYTVEVAEGIAGGPCSSSPSPTAIGGTASASFCSALTDALPRLGLSAGEIALAIGYRYEDDSLNSLFGTNEFMTVWACGGRQAQCVEGSAASLDVAGSAVVLDEIWLRNWLTQTGLRIWR